MRAMTTMHFLDFMTTSRLCSCIFKPKRIAETLLKVPLLYAWITQLRTRITERLLKVPLLYAWITLKLRTRITERLLKVPLLYAWITLNCRGDTTAVALAVESKITSGTEEEDHLEVVESSPAVRVDHPEVVEAEDHPEVADPMLYA